MGSRPQIGCQGKRLLLILRVRFILPDVCCCSTDINWRKQDLVSLCSCIGGHSAAACEIESMAREGSGRCEMRVLKNETDVQTMNEDEATAAKLHNEKCIIIMIDHCQC
jgi:hypothetical protein